LIGDKAGAPTVSNPKRYQTAVDCLGIVVLSRSRQDINQQVRFTALCMAKAEIRGQQHWLPKIVNFMSGLLNKKEY
jgi:phosphoribosyl-dephospho-CoA transferase